MPLAAPVISAALLSNRMSNLHAVEAIRALDRLRVTSPCRDEASVTWSNGENRVKSALVALSVGLVFGTALSTAATAQELTGVPGDVGSDTGTGVNDADYQSPFVFDGKLNRLTMKLLPPG